MRNDVDIEYRRNLAEFQQWEAQEDAKQKENIMKYKFRERQNAKGFKIPDSVVALAILALLGTLVWVFRAVILK